MSHARISEALNALVFKPTPGVELAEVLNQYYSPDYTHRADGRRLDFGAFTQMVAGIRDQVVAGEVTVLDELRDGSTYAERHAYRITLKNGVTQHKEVAVFATLAEDGRFQHLSETGFDLDAGEDRVHAQSGE
ncbi:nuclear transport factor 2 family protein [Streptomyces sp. NPDC013178]|uniref:nuclear transport factor 2 family protein n=1 Tax=Streptomyces sp. NPDC013178 TaxID=3155118 RepID=UPI0034088FD5